MEVKNGSKELHSGSKSIHLVGCHVKTNISLLTMK